MTIALLSENFLIIHNLKKSQFVRFIIKMAGKTGIPPWLLNLKNVKKLAYLKKFKKCLARDDSEFCYIFNILVHLNLLHNSMNNAAKTLKIRATQRAVLSMI